MKKTVVIGASLNPSRYANIVSHELRRRNREFVLVGIREGEVAGRKIMDLRGRPPIDGVDTLTLYLHARHQPEWYDYLLNLKPRRIIFNPGAENNEFAQMARQQGIIVEYACTLVMLSLGTY